MMTDLNWPRDLSTLTFMTNTLFNSKTDIEALAKGEDSENVVIKPVNVSYMDLTWFFKDNKNFVAFAMMLGRCDLPRSFYSSKFIQLLL